MRAMRLGLMVFTAIVGATLTLTARGQSTEAPCSTGFISMFGYGVGGKGTTPYTAKIKITFEQRLPEGNVIHSFAHLLAARNSAGRTRSEMVSQCHRGEDGKPVLDKQINIQDLKEHTNLHWQEGSLLFMNDMKATLSHFNVPSTPPPRSLRRQNWRPD